MAKYNANICSNMAIDDRWAELHHDLLDEIIKHVDFYDSLVRIRTVCRRWHRKLSKYPKHINNLLLVLPFDDQEEIFRPFHNITENKAYYMKLPETRNTIFRGSYYEWLIVVAIDGTVRMLNPFTRIHVDLPAFLTFPNVIDYKPDSEEYIIRVKSSIDVSLMPIDKVHMQKLQIKKVIISSQPEHVQDFMALAIYGERCQLCYYRFGDNTWTAFEDFGTIIEDATFYEGKIYVITWRMQLYEFEFDKKTRRISGGIVLIVPPAGSRMCTYQISNYVVGTPLGLLLVKRELNVEYHENQDFTYKTREFKVYKLSREGKKIEWLKVNNLGDYVLLLGYNTSMYFLAETLPDGKGNRIYCTDSKCDLHFQRTVGGQDIGVFDLEDGSFSTLFPDVQQLFPVPVWLIKKVF